MQVFDCRAFLFAGFYYRVNDGGKETDAGAPNNLDHEALYEHKSPKCFPFARPVVKDGQMCQTHLAILGNASLRMNPVLGLALAEAQISSHG